MFSYISGTVGMAVPNLVVIDVGGVGYAIHTSLNSSAAVRVGEKAKFYTFLNVKEDIFELYGFSSAEELTMFKQLISISGVGAKAGVSILSASTPAQVAMAIVSGDEKVITQAQGIGKKIAQRIILELRDKMAKANGVPGSVDVSGLQTTAGAGAAADAFAALEVLGYPKNIVLQVLGGVDLSVLKTEEIIREALKKLM